MKSIKPGRGPSMIGGFMGIFVCLFAIFWTVMAAQFSGAFAIFGIFFICIAVVMTIYNFKNATGKNRHSVFDITDENEETDPLNIQFGTAKAEDPLAEESKFCPYCGMSVKADFEFCPSCGKKLP